jgi:hypothetical protein
MSPGSTGAPSRSGSLGGEPVAAAAAQEAVVAVAVDAGVDASVSAAEPTVGSDAAVSGSSIAAATCSIAVCVPGGSGSLLDAVGSWDADPAAAAVAAATGSGAGAVDGAAGSSSMELRKVLADGV